MAKVVEDIGTLKINLLSQAQYDAEVQAGTVEPNELYLTPSSGSGVSDVEVDGESVVTGGVAQIDLTGKSDIGHTHTKSAITDFPTIPSKTSDLTNDSGFITGYTETDPVFSASAAHGISSSDISNWNGKSDFSGSYNDLTDKPTIPTKTMWVGSCSTGVSTSSKVVTTTTGDFVLAAGNSVRISFEYANQAGATLNIDGTGAKSLENSTYKWREGEIVDVIYNGANYEFVDGGVASGTYYGVTKLSDDISSTRQDIAATPYAVKRAYDLANSKSDFSGDYDDLTNKPTIPTVPTNVSAFTNDAGYLTSYTETDPIFSASAASGISSSDISTWNGKSDFSGNYNDLTNKPTIPTVPSNVSAFTNDAGYITGYTETDPTVPAWAKAASKPTYTASEVGALSASDVADYVVEEGSVTASPTGAFNYYRKWNSGKAEFWYSYYSSNGLTTATWTSPLAYKDVTTFSNIWDGVFVTVNTVYVLTRDSQSISIYPLSWTTSGVSNMRFVTVGTKSNNAYGISLYAFGTWK